MKVVVYMIMLFIACVSTQCNWSYNVSNKESITTNFVKGEPLDPAEWQCNVIDNDTICIPVEWEVVDQDKVYFFAQINKSDENEFFTILKYDIEQSQLTAENYLREVYTQLINDKSESFIGYTLKKITFNDKVSYYGEYYTEIKGAQYFSYSMVIENKGYLYDVALKVRRNVANNYRDTYKDILFNVKINEKHLFSETDIIAKIDTVKLSD